MGFFTSSRLKKMKDSFRKNDLKKATAYADKIKPEDVHTAYDLSMMADIYTEGKRYGEAKKVYTEMYNRNRSVRVCKSLIELSLKADNIKQAIAYIKDLKELDDEDYERYIYQYKIGKKVDKPEEYLIACLMKVKEADYIDIWALELAKLYYKSGRYEECVKECKNIKLWFPETEVAKKANILLEACAEGTSYDEAMGKKKKKKATRVAPKPKKEEVEEEESEEAYEEVAEDEATYEDEAEVDEAYDEDEADALDESEDDYDESDEEFIEEPEEVEDEYDEESEDEEYDEEYDDEDSEDDEYDEEYDDEEYEDEEYDEEESDDEDYEDEYDEDEYYNEAEEVYDGDMKEFIDDTEEFTFDSELAEEVSEIADSEDEEEEDRIEKIISDTIINDSLSEEVMKALSEQDNFGSFDEDDEIDEKLLRMINAEDDL